MVAVLVYYTLSLFRNIEQCSVKPLSCGPQKWKPGFDDIFWFMESSHFMKHNVHRL